MSCAAILLLSFGLEKCGPRRSRTGVRSSKSGIVINLLELPCRIRIRLDGLEWLIYNRTAAYDELSKIVKGHTKPDGTNDIFRLL